jgi:ATP-dependent Clp protease ATP-binding subunit ClpC
MRKRTRPDDVAPEPVSRSPEEVEAAARAAARAITERLDEFPDPAVLAVEPEFVRASDSLVAADVPVETVERLARSSSAVLAAMAHRATARRELVPEGWAAWAFRRMTKAYAGELVFLLEAVERHLEPPFLPRVLARANQNWTWGWSFGVISAFVDRRVAAGEQPTADELAALADPENEEHFAAIVAELEGVLPAATVRGFEAWREDRGRREFFRSFGRIWEPTAAAAPVLTSVGTRSAVLAALEAALQGSSPRSVLLVGEHGVGKSAVLREALRRLHEDGWLVFEAGAAEVNAGQSFVGQLEGRVREIVEHAAGRRVLWVLPAFEEALWAGQHSRNPHGLLDALLPFVEARQLVIVGELEPQAYELVVQRRPRVTSAFETLRLEPLDRDEAIAAAVGWREAVGVDVDDATIGDAYDLAQHYVAGVAAPGRLLRLLKAAHGHATVVGRDRVRSPDVLATLSEATGLPLHVVDPHAPLDLDGVRTFFSGRVLGQPEAVDCLVDRIALIKAGFTDPTRPLGVFLFVGPTGTGKTEIAKALAEFLFGSADRLVRLDMSEFQTERSYERLLADASSGDEAATLIASVRAKPFSVVLLDEFEKAHRNIWNLFLQLFDDGRLTDTHGRVADFRQCVVVLTSNLGAAVERGGRLGFASDAAPRFRSAAVERTLGDVFRPELLNRIDQIVVFQPFEREQMRALLERELAQVLERRGFRAHPWAVEWDEAALELLAEKGFSPELGARPLKRAVERYLLAPLATTIVSNSVPEGDQFLFITARDGRIEVAFVDPDAEPDEAGAAGEAPVDGRLRLEQLVLDARGGGDEADFLRAETERLRAVVDGDEWCGAKERGLETMRLDGFWDSADRVAVLARIEYVDRVQAALGTAEKLVRRLPQRGTGRQGAAREVVALLAERLYLLDRACAGGAADPADAFLELRASGPGPDPGEAVLQLEAMYEAWGRRRGMRVRRLPSDAGRRRLAISGIAAYQILASENGLHVFESPHGERADRVAVQVAVAPATALPPEANLAAQARLALREVPTTTAIVRRYRTGPSPLVRDGVRGWRTGRLDRVLAGEFDVFSAR